MISIIVPYRDRAEHLKLFLERMKTIKQEKEILIVEQEEGKPFNRGRLLNIGAINALGRYFVFHDVDLLPGFFVYPELLGVTQLVKSNIQVVGYLGGVTMFDNKTFYDSGGYPNDFFHRAEDNCMAFILHREGIPVNNLFLPFEELPHERPKLEFDFALWAKAQDEARQDIDYLWECEFKLLESTEDAEIRHIKVSI